MNYYVPVEGSLGYEEISCTTATAKGLTAANVTATGAKGLARVLVTTFPAATRCDGAAPTSATKQVWGTGQILYIEGYEELSKTRFIGIGGTTVLAVQYYKYSYSG